MPAGNLPNPFSGGSFLYWELRSIPKSLREGPYMLWSLSLVGLPALLMAATDDFRLEAYIPADFHRHYLSLSPQLSWEDSETGDRYSGTEMENSSARGSQGLSVRHGSKRQAPALRWSTSSALELSRAASQYRQSSGSVSGSEAGMYGFRTGGSSSERRYHVFASVQGTVQWYFGDWFFLALSADPWISAMPPDRSRTESWDLQELPGLDSLRYAFNRRESEHDELHAVAGGSVAIGYGRIEDVGFAETTLFLLDRIRAATGRDVRLTLEEVRALEVHLEARRRQRPFYDARMASIYDLEGIDAFLNARAGAERLSARAILEMADVWNHAGRHRRESGWELRVSPYFAAAWHDNQARDDLRTYLRRVPSDPGIDGGSLRPGDADTLNSSLNATRSRSFRQEARLGASLAMAYRRPWRRLFQFDWNASARASRNYLGLGDRTARYGTEAGSSLHERYVTTEYPLLEADVDGSAAFFPDTRTEVRAGLRIGGWKKLDYLGSKREPAAILGHEPHQDSWARQLEANLGAEYYLGPRLSVYVRAEAWWNRTVRRDEVSSLPVVSDGSPTVVNGWNSRGVSTRASLTYYLF